MGLSDMRREAKKMFQSKWADGYYLFVAMVWYRALIWIRQIEGKQNFEEKFQRYEERLNTYHEKIESIIKN